MYQVIVTDLFDWICNTQLPARRLGFWRWGKLHVPSNYDGPFRLDSQTTSNSASIGLLGLVTAFLIGSDWRPIDAITAQLHPDQPN
jgi:hypothetical protein